MNSKLLTTILAAALCAPQVAFAARDGEGMEYTSAAEGFYGSIRTVYKSRDGGDSENGSSIGADFSRLGVRGSLDLGGGLTGLYRYEWGINGDNGATTGSTRLSYVGLRGGWGEFKAGSHWAQGYNWVTHWFSGLLSHRRGRRRQSGKCTGFCRRRPGCSCNARHQFARH